MSAARAVCVVALLGLALASTAGVTAAAAGPRLTVAKIVDRVVASINGTLTYTVTLRNTGTAAASNVTVDDVFGGDAGYVVNDGTGGTPDSFAGSAVVVVARVSLGHYRWTYATVNPGDADIVRFTATITAPVSPPAPPARPGAGVVLTNTASSVGVTPATVRTTATIGRPRTPGTGAVPGLPPAVFLFLGGLGLFLVEQVVRRPRGALRRG